jgi:hypothetical protein
LVWLLLQSARQNARKYWLAIIGVAAAVLVATLGISASQAVWRMAQYPILQVTGGDLIIADESLAFEATGPHIYARGGMGIVTGAEVNVLITRALGPAPTSQTLFLPALVDNRLMTIQGRLDDTGSWLYMPRIESGVQLSPDGDGRALLTSAQRSKLPLGQTVTIRLARAVLRDGEWTMSLADGLPEAYTVTGTYGRPDPNGNPWLPLQTVQRASGFGDHATYVGVRVADPTGIDETARRLTAAITVADLPLQVITAREMAALMIADYARLESLSGYYIPAMCLIAVLIVVATGLVLATNRRRELSLLRSIGLSMAALRLLFIGECLAVVTIGAGAGMLLAALVTAQMFQYAVWNPLPALTVLGATVVLAVPGAFALFSRNGALRALRNP